MAAVFGDRRRHHEIHMFLFNETQQSIYDLMKTDSLLRFMKGDLFRRWMVVQRVDREKQARLLHSMTVHDHLQANEHRLVDSTSATCALEDMMAHQEKQEKQAKLEKQEKLHTQEQPIKKTSKFKVKKTRKLDKADRKRIVDPMELLMLG
jgi:hypothetical protein